MGKWRLFLAMTVAIVVASLFVTTTAAESEKTGHVDLEHNVRLFGLGYCEYSHKKYVCLTVRRKKEVYIRVMDENSQEIFQLKKMKNGKFEKIWARDEK